MKTRTLCIGAFLVIVVAMNACLESDTTSVVAIDPITKEVGSFDDLGAVPEGWAVCPDGDCSGVDDDLCVPEDCGPEPMMPNYVCDDGTFGGPTGRCLRNSDGSCGWEIRDCDVDDTGDCAEEECGPEPMMPNYVCDDGTFGGPTGRCLRNSDGSCGWEIRDCDVDDTGDCAEEECGAALGMPACICADGSIGCNTGRCMRFDDGTCGWEIRDCPVDDPDYCADDECPALGAPECICADGSIGCNTGRCLREDDGSCVAEFRDCPVDDPDYCADDECPALGAPACICADGSIGCNTGRCLREDDGSCVAEFRDCPEDGSEECAVADCGPELGMPNYLCPDGTFAGPTGRCLRNDDGACGWEIRECADDGTEECDEAECGPALGMPAWTCEDGSVGGNTGRCLRSSGGVCAWEIRDCPA